MTQSPEQRRLTRVAGAMNTKARRLGTSGEVTASDLALIYLGSRACFYCGIGLEPGHYSFDHVVAFNNGGINEPGNIVATCFSCNRKKFTKTQEEAAWYETLVVECEVCHKEFHPRFAEWKAGRARTCSRRCAANKRWQISA